MVLHTLSTRVYKVHRMSDVPPKLQTFVVSETRLDGVGVAAVLWRESGGTWFVCVGALVQRTSLSLSHVCGSPHMPPVLIVFVYSTLGLHQWNPQLLLTKYFFVFNTRPMCVWLQKSKLHANLRLQKSSYLFT